MVLLTWSPFGWLDIVAAAGAGGSRLSLATADSDVNRWAGKWTKSDVHQTLASESKRRVRFSLEESTVHEISPYSEIYGLHPSRFHFARDGELMPLEETSEDEQPPGLVKCRPCIGRLMEDDNVRAEDWLDRELQHVMEWASMDEECDERLARASEEEDMLTELA
mmetsp:Transcript_13236/g.24617  ORF Transcript_13236/g.24617 Transcript_13236/m.24617 type:complete len:165 (-) Transcript_13236:287-781(-)